MSALLINEPPLQVLPSLAVAIGLNEAIVLQQIHYWTLRLRPAEDGEVWVYNSAPQWREQFPFWSEDTILRTLKSLRSIGVLVAERRAKNSFDKTFYYRIDRQVLDSLDTRNLPVSKPQRSRSKPQDACTDTRNLPVSAVADCRHLYTETTAETTAESGAAADAPAAAKPRKRAAKPEAIKRPEGVDEQVWADYLLIRKQKRSTLTVTALSDLEREAGKAGMTLEQAMRMCCAQGWTSLRASWESVQAEARKQKRGAAPATDDVQARNAAVKAMLFGGKRDA